MLDQAYFLHQEKKKTTFGLTITFTSLNMAIDDDEDTVMGDAGSHTAPHVASHQSLSSTKPVPGQLNGRSDPWLAPPLLEQPVRVPLPAPESADNQGVSPPKSLPKSIDSTEVEDQGKEDSLVEENSDWSDDEVSVRTGLPLATLASGLCYDVQMRYHCEVRPTTDVHPEDPRRIYYIFKELCRAGLVDDPESSRPLVARPLSRINARNATEEEISLIHTPDHFAFVESTKG